MSSLISSREIVEFHQIEVDFGIINKSLTAVVIHSIELPFEPHTKT